MKDVSKCWFGLDRSIQVDPSDSGQSCAATLGLGLPVATDSICLNKARLLDNFISLHFCAHSATGGVVRSEASRLSYPAYVLTIPSVTDFSGFIAFVQTSLWPTDLDQPLQGLVALRPKPAPGRLFSRFVLGFPLGSVPSGPEIVI